MMKQRIYRLPNMRAATANMPDWIFILWAGGTALLSYSLVYALRKPSWRDPQAAAEFAPFHWEVQAKAAAPAQSQPAANNNQSTK